MSGWLWSSGAPAWQTCRDTKQQEREAAIARGKQLVIENPSNFDANLERDILSANAQEIVSNIASRKKGWTATSVLLVFINRAVHVHQKLNILTEMMFDQAVERARKLDEEFEKTGKVVGKLHGVPVSLKDQIDFEGFDSSIGLSKLVGKPATKHATLVQVLLEQGAVPFTKTAVPQTMLSFECSSPVFGKSLNPYDHTRVPGGSSGGEAALLGSDGSALGIGSDIGGSLRIPAHYSGCYGLKPCKGRFPSTGCVNPNPGFEAIVSTLGPMGRSVADLEILTRIFADKSVSLARTEGLIPLSYQEVQLPKKLKFGYYLTDGFCKASPACERAVMQTVEALRKAGHECVEITLPDPVRALEIFVGVTSADGYYTLLESAGRDPKEDALFLTTIGPRMPAPLRGLLSWTMDTVVGDPVFARVLRASKMKSTGDLQRWNYLKHQYVSEFKNHVWGDLGLDGILCAPQAVPALKLSETWDLSPLAFGTFLYNVVDMSAGVVPVTFVNPAKDAVTPEWREKTASYPGSKTVEKRVFGVANGAGGAYDAEKMQGLPVGVQVVAGQWEEEKVIEMMKVVDDALGPRGFGPGEYYRRESAK